MEDVTATYRKLYNSIDEETNSLYYKTVIIDSLTELQKLDMVTIMKEVVAARPQQDPDTPSQREWGKSAEHMRKIIRAYRDLPCNLIATALAASVTDQTSNVTSLFPSLPGKLRTEVPGFFDVVGLLRVDIVNDNPVRLLQTAKSARVIAKDRTGALEPVEESPSIPLLWEKIHVA